MRTAGRAALGLGLVFAWVLLVPLGPAAGVSAYWISAAAIAHAAGLAIAGAMAAQRRMWLRIGTMVFGLAGVAQVLVPSLHAPLLVVAAMAAAAPVLVCGGALATLTARQRPGAIAAGAALANLPLLVLHAASPPLLLRAGALASSLAAAAASWWLQPVPETEPGRPPARVIAAVGVTYLVGGVTYSLVLPELGGNPFGVLPYLLLLGVAAWLTVRLGRGAAIRGGLAALGLGALGWGLGWSPLDTVLAALLVGCWAFVDVGWWARLGDERCWTTSYGFGLAAMALAIGIGFMVTPRLVGVDPRGGAAVALAALLVAALLLPSESRAVPVRLAEAEGADRGSEAREAEGADRSPPFSADAASSVRLGPRERRVLELLAHGASNKEIARELGISEGTVRTHLERLYRKLGVRSRTEAAVWYWQVFLPSTPPSRRESDRAEERQ